ncbi:MAG: Ni/Fe-hydrogenase cytochrome b subunit [Calditrichaeota bacterium]|nr:Ni/Fe-hydrogenase cytochrome b subunit [Calditrichota bacterium]
MDELLKPAPVKRPFLSTGVIILIVLALNGIVWSILRFGLGLGAVTNLNNQYPWGLWIGIDVAAGVALAAGGFTTSALVHIFYREDFRVLVRPAIMTAMLGYTFVAVGVMFDLGRYYNIWHVPVMGNSNSVLFEVGICVMTYLGTLYIEFFPIVTERFIGKVHLKGALRFLNRPIDSALRWIDNFLDNTMFFFILLGVVLSCLHQSSLGTLMLIAGPKIHPLWQTPISPLLFLLSAFAVGFPMVIMESLSASRSLGLKPEMDVLARLARFVGPLLGVYLAFKIGDMVIRGTYVYLNEINFASVMWVVEILFGVIIPIRMFFWDKVLRSRTLLYLASLLVIFGVLINRFNVFITAYTPPYILKPYKPSIGEISITIGLISLEILLYRTLVMIFPVLAQPDKNYRPKAKFAIRGVIR